MFSSDYSLHWLAASIILLIFFGLLRMGIAVSKMMKDKDGNFEIISRTEGPHLLFDKDANFGVKYTKHQINQKAYEGILKIISYPICALSAFSFIVFCITVLT